MSEIIRTTMRIMSVAMMPIMSILMMKMSVMTITMTMAYRVIENGDSVSGCPG
jgi:hypothetical protein